MTKNYVASALEIFSSIQSKATQRSIKGLTIITSVGALAGVIRLLNQSIPTFSTENFLYFGALVVISYVIQKVMGEIGMRKSYGIKDVKISKDI